MLYMSPSSLRLFCELSRLEKGPSVEERLIHQVRGGRRFEMGILILISAEPMAMAKKVQL